MKELEERIRKDGFVIDNDILRVDSFINEQIDSGLLMRICQEITKPFVGKVDKVLTVEASGIAFGLGAALCLGNCPLVFAKKSKSKTVDTSNLYTAEVKSFTRGTLSPILIDKRFLKKGERVLIVDDFLAEGNASLGLINLCDQAGVQVVGVAVAIEKRFQGGRAILEGKGYPVVSAASIAGFQKGQVIFSD
jgi:xanthine phosphoribosyltransferase